MDAFAERVAQALLLQAPLEASSRGVELLQLPSKAAALHRRRRHLSPLLPATVASHTSSIVLPCRPSCWICFVC